MSNSQPKAPYVPPPHYVCTGGCKFVSEDEGRCPSGHCPRARNPLTECECTDGKHGDLLFLNAAGISK